MEEKVHEIRSAFRTIFNFGSSNKFFLRKPTNSKNHGFTLVEIIVVVGILGILTTALIALINPSLQLGKSRDGKRKSDLRQIQAGLELYRADLAQYPSEASRNVAICSGTSLANPCASPVVVYMQSVPKDPRTGLHYYYCTSSCGPGSGYRVYSCLENASDPDKASGAVPGFITCTSGAYFYVQNP